MKKFLSILLILTCFNISACKKENKEVLKASIFADVQLTNNNQDYTANAYVSLLDQLKFSKENNVDVLFMCGDIVNNAVESYYQLFEQALVKVYGNDESTYPEFVYTMGNHEWWDVNEQNDENATNLFQKYARIETDNLVAISTYKYPINQNAIIPSYYKVIKGVPFISYSAEGSSGKASNSTLGEIKSWLDEACKLPLVKKGGPIIIGYHYPLDQTTYDAANYNSRALVKLLKDYPQAIVFTGDTHYPSINERAINQTDFTSINIGSSSYTRMLAESAMKDKYDNVGGNSKDLATGDADFMTPYIENIQLLSIDNKGNTTIDRYSNKKKVGISWEIKAKEKFIYTKARYQNKEYAKQLYNQEGLSFDATDKVEYDIQDDKMLVKFKDVNNYNYCEHYKIKITANKETSIHDFVSTYHLYYDSKQTHCYVIDNIPKASSYKVEVEAYDFFDNPSINKLVAEEKSLTNLFYDDIELAIVNSYSNLSKRLNYSDTNNSNASIEYYFAGDKLYNTGFVLAEGNFSSIDVKNNNSYDLEFILEHNGQSEKRIVKPNEKFETISWNTNGILKVRVPYEDIDTTDGYTLSFLIDNLK